MVLALDSSLSKPRIPGWFSSDSLSVCFLLSQEIYTLRGNCVASWGTSPAPADACLFLSCPGVPSTPSSWGLPVPRSTPLPLLLLGYFLGHWFCTSPALFSSGRRDRHADTSGGVWMPAEGSAGSLDQLYIISVDNARSKLPHPHHRRLYTLGRLLRVMENSFGFCHKVGPSHGVRGKGKQGR